MIDLFIPVYYGFILISILVICTRCTGKRSIVEKMVELSYIFNVACEGGVAYGFFFHTTNRRTRLVTCGMALASSWCAIFGVAYEIYVEVRKKKPKIIRPHYVLNANAPTGISLNRFFTLLNQLMEIMSLEHYLKIVACTLHIILRIVELVLRAKTSTEHWSKIDRGFAIYPMVLAVIGWLGKLARRPKRVRSSVNYLLLESNIVAASSSQAAPSSGTVAASSSQAADPSSGTVAASSSQAAPSSSSGNVAASSSQPAPSSLPPPLLQAAPSPPPVLPSLLNTFSNEEVDHTTFDMWSMNVTVESKPIQCNLWKPKGNVFNLHHTQKLPTFQMVLIQFEVNHTVDYRRTVIEKWRPFLDIHAPDIPTILLATQVGEDLNDIQLFQANPYGLAYVECNISNKQNVEAALGKIWELYLAMV